MNDSIKKDVKLVISDRDKKDKRLSCLKKCQRLEKKGWKYRDGSYAAGVVCGSECCVCWMAKY